MNSISIKKADITGLDVDCIVNAANDRLAAGGGVCGAIFKAAGYDELSQACRKIGGCKTGKAVITPGFHLKAKFIIHAVGPVWQGGKHHESQQLYGCYKASLLLAKENGIHSIAFPLISSGIFGYPKAKAWRKALQACNDFNRDNPDYGMEVIFTVLSDEMLQMGQAELDRQDEEFIEKLKESKMVMVNGCPVIEAAIQNWIQGGREDAMTLINVLVQEMKDDAEVIAPVYVQEEMSGKIEPETEQSGAAAVCGQGLHFEFQHLSADDGKYMHAAFTCMEEVEKGDRTSTIPILLKDMIQMAFNEEDCDGLVINPWGDSVTLPTNVLGELLEMLRPMTEDEIYLNKGSDAYQNGDFEEAVRCYRQSAAAGNVTAMSNLGYCYYYGRSIPVDKEAARTCWEKAAVLGDVCAIYKLGDMYRNGDLPKDEVFSLLLYQKAFSIASETKNVQYFPDAALRILKYCKDSFTNEIYAEIARDAVDGFRKRIEDGDNYSEKLYREALAILEGINSKEK